MMSACTVPSARYALLLFLLFLSVGPAAGINLGVSDSERQMRREPLPIYRREEHDKVQPDYVESRSTSSGNSPTPSPALPVAARSSSLSSYSSSSKKASAGSLISEGVWQGEDTGETLMGQHLYKFNLERLVHSNIASPSPSSSGGVKSVSAEERSAVTQETETYQKVVKEAERETGLPDTVDTTTTSGTDTDSDETEENSVVGVAVVGLASLCIFSMIWSQRMQEKAHKEHDEQEKAVEDAHEAGGTAPAEGAEGAGEAEAEEPGAEAS